MSSFTDNPSLSFNPYIDTMATDALVRVELQKQEQFNQGYQQIQGQFQTIMGLPIAKQETKDYIQSKLTQLKNNIASSTTGDFSDMRLLNQIGGLTGRIANDPIVTNGVQSTARAQKAFQDIEEAKKSGKWSPENEWYFTRQYNEWVNDGRPDTAFDGSYTPYVDLSKKWLEVVQKLQPDGSLNDIPYEVTADGTINYDKLAQVMVKRGVEGISAVKIENAVRAVMTPEDYNQMRISGAYRFRDYTPEDLYKYTQKKYQSLSDQTTKALNDAEKRALSEKGNSDKYSQILEQIKAYKDALGLNGEKGTIEQQYEDELKSIDNDPEGAKAEIYKNGFISEFANAFSSRKEKQEYVDSPFIKAQQWQSDYDLRLRNSQREDQKFEWDKDMDVKRLNLEMQKLYGKGSGFKTYLGADTDIPAPAEAMKNESAALLAQTSQLRSALKEKLGGITDAELEKKISAYQNGDKTGFTPDQYSTVESIIKNTNDASSIQSVLTKTRKEAEQEVYKTNQTLDDILKGKNNLSFTQGGVKYTFSPREIYDFLQKEKSETITSVGGPGMGTSSTTTRSVDVNSLNPREKILYNQFKRRYSTNSFTTGDNSTDKYISDFSSINPILKENEKKVQQLTNQKLLSKGVATTWVPGVETINTPTSESRKNMEQLANTVLTRFSTDHGDNANSNKSSLESWFKDDKKRDALTYEHFIQGNKHQLWVKYGDKIAKLDLTDEEASQLPTSLKTDASTMGIQKKLSLGQGNTNIFGTPDKSAFLRGDFKNVRKLNVSADLQKDLLNDNVYLMLNIVGKDGNWSTVQYSKPFSSIRDAQQYISQATDDVLLNDAIKQAQDFGNDKLANKLSQLKQQ